MNSVPKIKKLTVSVALGLLFSHSTYAKELTIVPSITVDNVLVAHERLPAGSNSSLPHVDTSLNTNTLNLALDANWLTKKINAMTKISTEFINRTHISGTEEEDLDAFLQLSSLATVNLWQDKLFLTTELNRTQQSSNTEVNIDSKLVGGSRWFNVNDGRLALDYRSKLGPYANFTGQVSTKKTQANVSSRSLPIDARRINVQGSSAAFQLDNQENNQAITWNISGSYGETRRASLNDVKNGAFDVDIYAKLNRSWSLTAIAEQSINQVEGNSAVSTLLEFEQVGIGLQWLSAKSSEFELRVYNASSERDSNEIYVGGKLLLNFSKFSQLKFEKKKNALGQADSFALSLQGQRFNLNLNYEKAIDINVRQGLSIASPESFICPFASNSINDCIINTTPNFTNNTDFFETTFAPNNFELNEQVVNSESLVFKLGYDNQRKIKLSLTAQKTHQINLESATNNRNNESITGLLLYRLSHNSELSINASINEIENVSQNQTNEQSQYEVRFSEDLGRKTNWQAFIKQIDSEQSGFKIEEVQVGANISFSFK